MAALLTLAWTVLLVLLVAGIGGWIRHLTKPPYRDPDRCYCGVKDCVHRRGL